MSAFCIGCGSGLMENARFCTACGVKVETASPVPPVAVPVTVDQTPGVVVAGAKAGFIRRSVAGVIDYILVCIAAIPMTAPNKAGTVTVLLVGLFIAYYVLMETFWNGQTLGKRLVNLRAVDAGGGPITIKQVVIRTVGRIIAYAAVGLLFLALSIPLPLFWLIPPAVLTIACVYYTRSDKPTPWDAPAKTTVLHYPPLKKTPQNVE